MNFETVMWAFRYDDSLRLDFDSAFIWWDYWCSKIFLKQSLKHDIMNGKDTSIQGYRFLHVIGLNLDESNLPVQHSPLVKLSETFTKANFKL